MKAGQATICKGCWEQKRLPIPIRGMASAPFRAVGVKPSRMNPDTCTICEMMFARMMKARKITIDASVLFADLRGYTTLSESHGPEAISQLLDAFYDVAAEAVWDQEGLVIKTMGDAVLALFNFPMERENHPQRAIAAARELQANWAKRRSSLKSALGEECEKVGVGIGIDCGDVSFGEFGRTHQDLTAIGAVVNRAARAQGAAEPDRILVTRAVYEKARPELVRSAPREYVLKGFADPIELFAA